MSFISPPSYIFERMLERACRIAEDVDPSSPNKGRLVAQIHRALLEAWAEGLMEPERKTAP